MLIIYLKQQQQKPSSATTPTPTTTTTTSTTTTTTTPVRCRRTTTTTATTTTTTTATITSREHPTGVVVRHCDGEPGSSHVCRLHDGGGVGGGVEHRVVVVSVRDGNAHGHVPCLLTG